MLLNFFPSIVTGRERFRMEHLCRYSADVTDVLHFADRRRPSAMASRLRSKFSLKNDDSARLNQDVRRPSAYASFKDSDFFDLVSSDCVVPRNDAEMFSFQDREACGLDKNALNPTFANHNRADSHSSLLPDNIFHATKSPNRPCCSHNTRWASACSATVNLTRLDGWSDPPE